MYRIFYAEAEPLYTGGSSIYTVESPTLDMAVNEAGKLTFSVPPINPAYDKLQRYRQDVYVEADGSEIFRGRIVHISRDWFNNKYVEVAGELAYLSDTIMRQKKYTASSVSDLFTQYVNYHNGWIYADRRFVVGQCTVTSTETSIIRYSNYETTLKEMKKDLLDNYGGYFRIRRENGNRIIDYLADYAHEAPQAIEFSKNLLDLSTEWEGSGLFTRLIPLGATLEESQRTWRAVEGLEEYLTIANVNGGDDWLDAPQSVKDYFGVITATMRWDDVHDANILKTKARAVIDAIDWDGVTITAKAFDLNLTDKTVEKFRLGDTVTVKSGPHGVSTRMTLSKWVLKLDNPADSTFTIGIPNGKGISQMLGGLSR